MITKGERGAVKSERGNGRYLACDGKGLSFTDPSQSGQLAIVELKGDGTCQFAGSP